MGLFPDNNKLRKVTYHNDGDVTVRLNSQQLVDIRNGLLRECMTWSAKTRNARLNGEAVEDSYRAIRDQVKALHDEISDVKDRRDEKMDRRFR